MPKDTSSVTPSSSDEAMNAALQAEQQALDGIKACEKWAVEFVDRARHQARAIAERTDRRITALHARRTGALAETVDAILSADSDRSGPPPQLELERKMLEVAVARIAARLTGATEK